MISLMLEFFVGFGSRTFGNNVVIHDFSNFLALRAILSFSNDMVL